METNTQTAGKHAEPDVACSATLGRGGEEQDFHPATGWVVVTGRNKRTGRRYAHLDTVSSTRSGAIEAYLRGMPFTWVQAKRMHNCAVVRCTLAPTQDQAA